MTDPVGGADVVGVLLAVECVAVECVAVECVAAERAVLWELVRVVPLVGVLVGVLLDEVTGALLVSVWHSGSR